MTNVVFEEILNKRLKLIRSVLGTKAGEYSQNGDRLYNFHVIAQSEAIDRKKVLWMLMQKHIVCVRDMVNGVCETCSMEYIEEKIGDVINYLILLEAMLKEEAEAADEDSNIPEFRYEYAPVRRDL